MGRLIEDAARCTHCNLCQNGCSFLSKYGIDIGDIDKLNELAYHCFLCGECTRVCPIDIDGRGVILEMRRERVSDEVACANIKKKYKSLLAEKSDYKFRNYKRATSGVVYFPGCNFPSLFPKTSEYISKLLMENHGIGTVYDCCGKPVAELGLSKDEQRIIDDMNRRFEEQGITEIVTACPNCWDFLPSRVNVPVVDIYTKLRELGYGTKVEGDVKMFIPCPDRGDYKLLDAVKYFVDGEVEVISGINCCGLGGSAGADEPELARAFAKNLKATVTDANKAEPKTCDDAVAKEASAEKAVDSKTLYTYCASCTGSFTRNGVPVGHILTEILGTHEKPNTTKSYFNRMMTKRKK